MWITVNVNGVRITFSMPTAAVSSLKKSSTVHVDGQVCSIATDYDSIFLHYQNGCATDSADESIVHCDANSLQSEDCAVTSQITPRAILDGEYTSCSAVDTLDYAGDGGMQDGSFVWANGRFVYIAGGNGVARMSAVNGEATLLSGQTRGLNNPGATQRTDQFGFAMFSDAITGQNYRFCRGCNTNVLAGGVGPGQRNFNQLQCLDDQLRYQSYQSLPETYTMGDQFFIATGGHEVAFFDSSGNWMVMQLSCNSISRATTLSTDRGYPPRPSFCASLTDPKVLEPAMSGILERFPSGNYYVVYPSLDDAGNSVLRRYALSGSRHENQLLTSSLMDPSACHDVRPICSVATDWHRVFVHFEKSTYKPVAVNSTAYVGCFRNSRMEGWQSLRTSTPEETAIACAELCGVRQGPYAFASVRGADECLCSNTYGEEEQLDISTCNSDGVHDVTSSLCGDGNQSTCAGHASAVYQFELEWGSPASRSCQAMNPNETVAFCKAPAHEVRQECGSEFVDRGAMRLGWVNSCTATQMQYGGDDGGFVWNDGRYTYFGGSSGIGRWSTHAADAAWPAQESVTSNTQQPQFGWGLFADPGQGQTYRLCNDCASNPTLAPVNPGGTFNQLQCLNDRFGYQTHHVLPRSYTMNSQLLLAVGGGRLVFYDSDGQWQLLTLVCGEGTDPIVQSIGEGEMVEHFEGCASNGNAMSGILEYSGGLYSVVYAGNMGQLWRKILPDGEDVMISNVNSGEWPWSGDHVCSVATDYRSIFVHFHNADDGNELLVSCHATFHRANPLSRQATPSELEWNSTAIECPFGTRVFGAQVQVSSGGTCPFGSHTPITEADCAAASNLFFEPDGWPVHYNNEARESQRADGLVCHHVQEASQVVWGLPSRSTSHLICVCG